MGDTVATKKVEFFLHGTCMFSPVHALVLSRFHTQSKNTTVGHRASEPMTTADRHQQMCSSVLNPDNEIHVNILQHIAKAIAYFFF